jgi:hypothetical protein
MLTKGSITPLGTMLTKGSITPLGTMLTKGSITPLGTMLTKGSITVPLHLLLKMNSTSCKNGLFMFAALDLIMYISWIMEQIHHIANI